MPRPPNILLFGVDPQLMETRRMVLVKAGFRVHTALRMAEFERAGDQASPDVVVLCHTLSEEDCVVALDIAERQWPAARRLVLVAGNQSIPERARKYAWEAAEGPARLVAQVGQLARTPNPLDAVTS